MHFSLALLRYLFSFQNIKSIIRKILDEVVVIEK